MKEVLESKFEITTMIGHDKDDTKQVKVFKRVIEVHDFGHTYGQTLDTQSSSSKASV